MAATAGTACGLSTGAFGAVFDGWRLGFWLVGWLVGWSVGGGRSIVCMTWSTVGLAGGGSIFRLGPSRDGPT